MMEYDTEAHIRTTTWSNRVHRTHHGRVPESRPIRELAVSETQKFGHVTYFWNGNRSGKIDEEMEEYIEIPSDRVPFEQRPWMKAAEITDTILEAIESKKYDFIRLNFPTATWSGIRGSMMRRASPWKRWT